MLKVGRCDVVSEKTLSYYIYSSFILLLKPTCILFSMM